MYTWVARSMHALALPFVHFASCGWLIMKMCGRGSLATGPASLETAYLSSSSHL